jgi:glutamine amidotransferase-like uncharacterized protein
MILIYQDYVHNHGILHRSLCSYFGTENIGYCDKNDILNNILTSEINCLVMPGGADLYYCEKLNGKCNKIIRSYVENGGKYLGICAGAYYACAKIEWAKNEGNDAICGPRELGFFSGLAIGPVYEFIEDNDFNKSWHSAASISYNDNTTKVNTLVSYEAGPFFTGCDNENCNVLARYNDLPENPAAIVECNVGKGTAILCSPHIERSSADMLDALYMHRFYRSTNKSPKRTEEIISKLKPYDEKIQNIWLAIMKRITTK